MLKKTLLLFLAVSLPLAVFADDPFEETKDSLIHTLSGVRIKKDTDKFMVKGKPILYAADGSDSSIAFISPGWDLEGTFYVYMRNDAECIEEFRKIVSVVQSLYADSFSLITANKVNIAEIIPTLQEGYMAFATHAANYHGEAQEVLTFFMLFSSGQWFFKYRITMPYSKASEVKDLFEALLNLTFFEE